jgi:hypothetical protein
MMINIIIKVRDIARDVCLLKLQGKPKIVAAGNKIKDVIKTIIGVLNKKLIVLLSLLERMESIWEAIPRK